MTLAGIVASENKFPKVIFEERLSDGSDTANPPADHRSLFLGEDGLLHWRDSSGTVTDIVSAAAHVADTSAAHAASSIGFTPASGIAATDVQAAVVEDAGDLAAHLADTSDAHDASAISFSPTGTIASTDVQAAIAEVASEAGGGGISSGTSNPGSPTNGDLFYRSDLDLLIRYRSSGTRWVCTCLHMSAIGLQTATIPNSVNGSLYAGIDATARDLFLERIAIGTIIPSGTNNGTSFWTISAGAFGSAVTSADGNAIARHDIAGGVLTAGAAYFELTLAKTVTPGALYCFATLVYRYIVT